MILSHRSFLSKFSFLYFQEEEFELRQLLSFTALCSLFCFYHKVIKNMSSNFLRASSSAPLIPFHLDYFYHLPPLSVFCPIWLPLLLTFSSSVQGFVLKGHSDLSILSSQGHTQRQFQDHQPFLQPPCTNSQLEPARHHPTPEFAVIVRTRSFQEDPMLISDFSNCQRHHQ